MAHAFEALAAINRSHANSKKSIAKGQVSHLDPFHASDFGVEIGGYPDFEDLPRSGYNRKLTRKLKRKYCVVCHDHRALFKRNGEVRYDPDHKLCFRCHQSEIDRFKAQRLRRRNVRS